ncbi:MAG: NUDIX domain-containing protein [Chloroflexi bacterium]|nr:MAG: NUDIX domain-containing protein [Chloroflexota bacterium]
MTEHHTHTHNMSAPTEFVYCPRCATPMETRQVGDKPRRVCPACEYIYFTDPKVGVGVLVVSEGKVLLVRRVMNPERGKWSIPAGFVDRGENPQETAVREAQEETGLDVVIDRLLDVYYNPPEAGGASIFILYEAHIAGGTLRPGDDADRAEFFGADELPDLAFASTKDAIRRWQQTLTADKDV